MTISQSRMVLATTGIRPMEKITISAAVKCQCGITYIARQGHTSLPLVELQQWQQRERVQQQHDISEHVDPALRVHKRCAVDAHERNLCHVPGSGDGETGEDLDLGR